MASVTAREILIYIITFFLPPLGVFLAQGRITNEFWISLLLTLLAWLPGLLFAVWVIAKYGIRSDVGNGELDEPIL